MYKHSQIDIADIEVLTGNIIYLTLNKGVVLDLETAQRMVRTIDSMLDPENEFRAGIFDVSGVVYVEEDARDYFARGEDTTGTTVGIALISNSFLGRTIGNLFLTLHPQTKFPIKLFESPIRAEHWIRGQIRAAKGGDAEKQVA